MLQHIQSGKLKVLAIAGGTRAAQIPDAPTTGESGLPGVLMDTNYGVIVPEGTSQEIVRKLHDSIAAALKSDEVKAEYAKQGAVPAASSPDEYAKLMAAEYDKWNKVVTRGKITID